MMVSLNIYYFGCRRSADDSRRPDQFLVVAGGLQKRRRYIKNAKGGGRMVLVIKAESGPPCCHALRPKHRGRRGGRTVSDGQPGKPRETAGRKAIGTKAGNRYVSLTANYRRI